VPQALWSSELVAYTRCFGNGRRFGLATEEPPTGFEPVTYALREARETVPGALPALIAAHLPGMHSAHSALQILGHDTGHGAANRPVTVCYQHCFGWRLPSVVRASLSWMRNLQHDRPAPGTRCDTWDGWVR
jgi:hypothetical protein